MLPDRVCRLLTAYVDGELSTRQREAVEHLLGKSAEARALLQQMQEDAALLRGLPRPKLDEEFPRRVLHRITERRLPLARRAGLAQAPAFPAWAGLAAAAAVLLVVSVSTYWYFASTLDERRGTPAVADQTSVPRPAPDQKPSREGEQVVKAPEHTPPKETGPEEKPVPPPRDPVVQLPKKEPTPEAPPGTAPERSPGTELAVPNPTPKMEVFEKVNLGSALSLSVHDLDQEKAKQRLREELQKETAYRLELSCLGNGKAFERLQEALKTQGLRLLVDQLAQNRLKNRLYRTDYVLYTDDLTAEELARVLEQLGTEDKKAAARRRSDAQFGNVLINPLTAADHAKLSELLGVDPTQLPRPKAKGPLGVDLRKPLAETTTEQVVEALKGQGPPKSSAGRTPIKAPERQVLILPYNPERSRPASSKAVQQFLANRHDRHPGTIQLLLFLRGANG